MENKKEHCYQCGKEKEDCHSVCNKCRWREPLHKHILSVGGVIIGVLFMLSVFIGVIMMIVSLVVSAINSPNIEPELLDEICHKLTGDKTTFADIKWSSDYIEELDCIKHIEVNDALEDRSET